MAKEISGACAGSGNEPGVCHRYAVIMGDEVLKAMVIHGIYTRVVHRGVDCVCSILGDPVLQYLHESLPSLLSAKSYACAISDTAVGLAVCPDTIHCPRFRAIKCHYSDSKPTYTSTYDKFLSHVPSLPDTIFLSPSSG